MYRKGLINISIIIFKSGEDQGHLNYSVIVPGQRTLAKTINSLLDIFRKVI